MDGSKNYYVEQKMPDTREYILYDPFIWSSRTGKVISDYRNQNNSFLWEGYWLGSGMRGLSGMTEMFYLLIWMMLDGYERLSKFIEIYS